MVRTGRWDTLTELNSPTFYLELDATKLQKIPGQVMPI